MNDSNASHERVPETVGQSYEDPHDTDAELEGGLKAPLSSISTLEESHLTMADEAPSSHDLSPDLITTIKQDDVLMGRGSGPNEFIGNQRFRSLVEARKGEYKSAPKNKLKTKIAKEVIDEIHALGGRFLKQVETGTPDINYVVEEAVWCEVEEKLALEKCKQTLRQKENPVGTNESRNASAVSSDVGVCIAVYPESFGKGLDFEHPPSLPPNWTPVLPLKRAGPSFGVARPMFFLQQQATSAQPMAANPFLSTPFVQNQNGMPVNMSQEQDQCAAYMRYLAYSALVWTQMDYVSPNHVQSSSLAEADQTDSVPTSSHFTSENGFDAAASQEYMLNSHVITGGDAALDDMLDQMDNSSSRRTSSASEDVAEDEMSAFLLPLFDLGSDSPRFTQEQEELEQAAMMDEEKAAALADLF
jgi:hypothetical protein